MYWQILQMQAKKNILLIIRKMNSLRKKNRSWANRKGNIYTPIVQVMNLSLIKTAMEKVAKKLESFFPRSGHTKWLALKKTEPIKQHSYSDNDRWLTIILSAVVVTSAFASMHERWDCISIRDWMLGIFFPIKIT